MNLENKFPSTRAPEGGPGAPPPGQAARRSAPPTSRLWLWVVAVISLQLVAWTAWFILASRHPVAEVPLATSGKQ